jgi:4-amino-4-deoxy-L-arabinose transferase-like glycosyltransferase
MKTAGIFKNPFIFFLPFLAACILFVFFFQTKNIIGDESRYINDADNLLRGYLSPPPPEITLSNGPGYAFLLMPFRWLGLSVGAIRLLNPFFLYLSLILLYKVLKKFLSSGKSFFCCVVFFTGCFLNLSTYMYMAIPEVLTVLLVILLLLLLVTAFDKKGLRKHWIWAGIVFGYLCLTKVVFGYVLACMFAGVLVIWLLNKQLMNNRKMLGVVLVAFISVTPYLAYTWQLTNRFFYWSSLGGNNLYWMSTTHETEYGSWFRQPEIKNGVLVAVTPNPAITGRSGYVSGHMDSIFNHNKTDLLAIVPHEKDVMALDDAYKKAAIKNIKEHPGKFLVNVFSNAGRVVFNFPYSYGLHKPTMLVRIPLNGTLVLLFFFCLFPALRNWQQVPLAIRFMFFIMAFYFGGSLLGSAEIRMFNPIAPFLLVFISFVLPRIVQLKPARWSGNS